MKKVLVIVDMQRGFPTSKKKSTILNCQNLISEFKGNHDLIFVLEYVNHGETLPQIKKLIEGYKDSIILSKDTDGGDRVINYHLRILKFKKPSEIEIYLCGVNIEHCVRRTAEGLAILGYKVFVVKDACNGMGYSAGWEHYRQLPNLKNI